jgi:hypothetical protein
MRLTLIDPKIRRRWRRYALQVSLATTTLNLALVIEQALAGGVEARAVIVAAIASTAIASTAFVLFISPESASARASHAIGGHAWAMVVGSLLALAVDTGTGSDWITTAPVIFSIYAALGVGLTMFLMAMTNTEHPPAAGTALAIVAHGFEWELVLFVAGAVLFMVGVHRLLRRHLLDLF